MGEAPPAASEAEPPEEPSARARFAGAPASGPRPSARQSFAQRWPQRLQRQAAPPATGQPRRQEPDVAEARQCAQAAPGAEPPR
jgi:hypothetical protein